MLIRRPRPGDGNKPCCIQYGLVYVDMTSAFCCYSLLFDGVYSTWGLHLSVLLEFGSNLYEVQSG